MTRQRSKPCLTGETDSARITAMFERGRAERKEAIANRAGEAQRAHAAIALELLEGLMIAFGRGAVRVDPADAEKRRKRASHGLPTDVSERAQVWLRELAESLPTLTRLDDELRALRGPELPSPGEYAERWRGIIATWNEAIDRGGWQTMPPLCDDCGRPVILRSPEKLRRGIEISTVCSDRCRTRRNDRLKKRAARARKARL